MKKIYVLWSLALATLMANVFFACKSDDTIEDFILQHGFTLNPAQNPDFVIYSNGKVLATTLGTRGESGTDVTVNGNYYKVQDWENTTPEHMPAEYAPYRSGRSGICPPARVPYAAPSGSGENILHDREAPDCPDEYSAG